MLTVFQEIRDSYRRRRQSSQFSKDIEFLAKLSLKDLNNYSSIQESELKESLQYLIENHRLTPLYKRFISPRKIFGKLIDRIKNKFYYETHYFIGGIVEKQEELNKHTANAIDKISIRQKKLCSSLGTIKSVLQDIHEVLKELKTELAPAIEENTENIIENKKKLSELSTVTASQFEQLDSELGSITSQIENLKSKHKETGKALTNLDKSVSTRIKKLKYPELDFNYIGFEEKFYGDHVSLQKKHSHYLQYLKGCNNVLDIGSGSGAFLSLLKQNAIKAYGIDSNPNVVKSCLEYDLEVRRADAINHLKSLKNNSLDGISCFHVIEHLHPDDFLKFIKLCFQKLQKGKYLLLETPNTQMLGVLNKGFYMDLTHVRPVHPETAVFLLEDIGFSQIGTYTLSQLPEGDRLQEVQDQTMNKNIQKLNRTLFGDQDLTIIAKK